MKHRKCFAERRRHGGFSLVELLVVVVLIGLAAYIGTVAVGALIQKQKLAAAANDVRTFLHDVPNQVAKTQGPVFVVYRPASGSYPAQLRISRDVAGTQVIRTLNIPGELVVEHCTWPAVGSTNVLRCDTLNRATHPTTNLQISSAQGLFRITHSKMVAGTLKPKRSYEIQVAPLWGVSIHVVP